MQRLRLQEEAAQRSVSAAEIEPTAIGPPPLLQWADAVNADRADHRGDLGEAAQAAAR